MNSPTPPLLLRPPHPSPHPHHRPHRAFAMAISSVIAITTSALEKLREQRMSREQRKRLGVFAARITVFTTGLFASYPTFDDILRARAGNDWHQIWDCIGRIAGATGALLRPPARARR